jgi:hypothetical protein
MKTPSYTLADEEFAFFNELVHKKLTDQGIDHTLVGDVAVQGIILDRLCKHSGRTVTSLATDAESGLYERLRSTGGVDVAISKIGTNSEVSGQLLNFCDFLGGEYISHDSNHLFEFEPGNRIGARRSEYMVGVDNITGEDLTLSLYRGLKDRKLNGLNHPTTGQPGIEDVHGSFVEAGVSLSIPFSEGYIITLNVVRPEHLMAVKIAQDRPKDHMDLGNLVAVMNEVGELEGNEARDAFYSTIGNILGPQGAESYSRFGSLVDLDVEKYCKA